MEDKQYTKEMLAEWMHDTYERLAREEEWATQKTTRTPFSELPEANKRVMLRLADLLIEAFSLRERKYTQKELYEFVTEYSREAREEGFDMSVGDFVDWVASRDEQDENRYIDPTIIEMARRMANDINDKLHGIPDEKAACTCHCHTNHNGLDGTNGKANCKCIPRCEHCWPPSRKEDKPVLPEKINDYANKGYGPWVGSQSDDKIEFLRDKLDAVIDYLSRKEQ